MRRPQPFVLFAFALSTFNAISGEAHDCDVIRIEAGATETVWVGLNVRGKVYLTLRQQPNSVASAWWVDYARLGATRNIGDLPEKGVLDIPWPGFSKLRVFSSKGTDICVSDKTDVRFSYSW